LSEHELTQLPFTHDQFFDVFGAYNLALTTPGSTAVSLASRESGANAPQLIVETAP